MTKACAFGPALQPNTIPDRAAGTHPPAVAPPAPDRAPRFAASGFRRLILLLAAALGFSAACSDSKPPAAGPAQPPAAPVKVATVAKRTVPVQRKAVGNVEVYSTVALKSQVEGQVVGVHFKEGQDVRKNDLLFTIDPRPFKAALDQAQASLERDKIQAANARRDAERYAGLIKTGVVSKEQYDQVRTQAEALEAAVVADQAALENAKLKLDYCTLRSPLDGRTGSLLIDEGNVIKTDTVLVVINQLTPCYVAFAMPEQYLPDIREYMAKARLKVEAFVSGDPEHFAVGELTFVDNTVNMALGTIVLKGTFPNADRTLWPGQFVDVVLTLATEPDAVVVPSQAVQTGQAGPYVWIVKPDRTAFLQPIVIDRSLGGETVVKKGLDGGETVVTEGQLRLVSGAPVEVKDSETTPTVAR